MLSKNDNTEYGTGALLGRKYMPNLIVQVLCFSLTFRLSWLPHKYTTIC